MRAMNAGARRPSHASQRTPRSEYVRRRWTGRSARHRRTDQRGPSGGTQPAGTAARGRAQRGPSSRGWASTWRSRLRFPRRFPEQATQGIAPRRRGERCAPTPRARGGRAKPYVRLVVGGGQAAKVDGGGGHGAERAERHEERGRGGGGRRRRQRVRGLGRGVGDRRDGGVDGLHDGVGGRAVGHGGAATTRSVQGEVQAVRRRAASRVPRACPLGPSRDTRWRRRRACACDAPQRAP